MKHINDVEEFLGQFKTVKSIEKAFGEIPSKFGSFEITNKETAEEDGYVEICNSYWDDIAQEDDEYYFCIDLV